jgi:hypothetical protein
MNSLKSHLVLAGVLLAASAPSLWAVEVITVRSGNGLPSGLDSQLTYLAGPADSEFGVALAPAQFAAAQVGPAPTILPVWALNGSWTSTLSADPLAQWVSDNVWGGSSGDTNLYAVPFFVTSGSVGSATLDFHFLCDNWIGEFYANVNEGVYINGTPIAGTTGGNYATETSFLGLNVAGLVTPGPNTLYVLSSDVGGPGGLIFSATVRIDGDGTVGAEEQTASFELGAAYPNPFNPVTTLPFEMSETGQANLTVHDLVGREVATLFDGLAERGTHEVRFDGSALPSGLYLYTLTTDAGRQTRKLVLNK